MRQQPSAVTLIGQQRLTDNHITSLKGAANLVHNLFMPDYGSRLTSAMYIRGIGSRMNTPAVGLYVDNIPYIDKSAFDFNFYDIERIDILRGPQGTLYGRNTMGGLIRIVTRNPFDYDGTDVKLGYATGDNHRNIALTHYHQVNGQLAFSAGGYYEGGDGFFKNDFTYKKADKMQAGGGRIRGIYKATDQLSFDLNVNYDYTDEGAYPYYYTGSFTEYEPYWNLIGKISNNRESSYLRSLFNAGLNIEYKADSWQMNAITGFQHLNDRMLMDQDFLTPDIYTLEQKQRINTLTEEVSFKNTSKDSRWHWVSGANMMYQTLHTDGPVTFYEQGVSGLIESNINGIFNQLKESNPKMPTMGIALQDRNFVVSSNMDTPSFNLAAFHSSSINWKNWKLTAGLRLEYEKLYMRYYSDSDITFDFNLSMSPMMNFSYPDLKASPVFDGDMNKDYLQVLPKVSLMYRLSEANNIYATISKGHRSGGYNVQMFSDLIQGAMRNQMIANIDEAQLIEGAMLALFNHETLIATKSYRICEAAKPYGVMEFGLRRAMSFDAGIYGAKAACIAGCIGTSNVLTAKMFDVAPLGTMAHSFIMSFDDEYLLKGNNIYDLNTTEVKKDEYLQIINCKDGAIWREFIKYITKNAICKIEDFELEVPVELKEIDYCSSDDMVPNNTFECSDRK